MKLALTTVLIACCAAPAFAQDAAKPAPAPAAAPSAAPAQADKPAAAPAAAPDPKSVKEAEAMFAEVAKAYKNAKTISDTIKMSIDSPMGQQSLDFQVAVGTGSDALLKMQGMSLIAFNGNIYAVRDDVKDKYITAKLDEGGFTKALDDLMQAGPMTPMHIVLHTSDKPDAQVNSLTMGMLQNVKITGHQTAKGDDGAEVSQILIAGDNGKGTVAVNPKTNLIQAVQVEMTPPGAPEGFTVKANLGMSPKVADSLEKPITFDPGKRTLVKSMDELEPTAVKEGEAAPTFTLNTLGGESISLAKLQGSVVVLDFWATWCPPCKKGLPLVNEFAKWAADSKQPIKVYAVDVWERTKSPEETKTKVADFWKANGFGFETLLDLDNSVVGSYGFNSIPTTVIVGPNGKIYKIHSGFEEGMVETLKKDVADAMKTTG